VRTFFFVVLAFIFGTIFPLQDVLQYKYFLGYDPFTTAPIARYIISSHTIPTSLSNAPQGTGFFYFVALFYTTTNISLYSISRFGGPIFLGLISVFLFLIGRRIFKSDLALIVPFFFVTNNWVVRRFMMTIRENFTLIFVILLLFSLVVLYQGELKRRRDILIPSIILTTIIASHLLSSYVMFTTIALTVFFFVVRNLIVKEKKWKSTEILILIVLLSFLIAFPFSKMFISFLSWGGEQTIKSSMDVLNKDVTKADKVKIEGWYLKVDINHFSIIEILLAPIGFFYVINTLRSRYREELFFFLSLTITSLMGLMILPKFIQYPNFRFILYISICLAIFAGLCLLNIVRYTIKKSAFRSIVYIIIILLIIPTNSSIAIKTHGWHPWGQLQYDAATFLNNIEEKEPGIIFTPYSRDSVFLGYVGLKNFTVDSYVNSIANINELKEYIILKYPNTRYIYFFVSNRFIRHLESDKNFHLFSTLAGYSKILYGKGALVLQLDLNDIRECQYIMDDDGSREGFGSISFNDRKIKKILVINESSQNITSAKIVMLMSKRDKDKSGNYQGNWSITINGYKHTYNWSDIPEGWTWVTKEISVSELVQGNNIIIISKYSPDHLFVGVDTNTDYNRSAHYHFGKWHFDQLDKWYGSPDGEYMIRLLYSTN